MSFQNVPEEVLSARPVAPVIDYNIKLIELTLTKLLDSLRTISHELTMRERQDSASASLAEKADAVLAVAKDTNATVRRIDARDVKRGKRQAEIDRQDKCFAIWEAGQRKEGVVALAGKKRVSRGNVFEYYKRELGEIGVGTAGEFARLLHARAQRLSRHARN